MQYVRVLGFFILILGLPFPLIHFDMMIFYFHNWTYWAQIPIFGMLIFPAFINLPSKVDPIYDKILIFFFTQGMALQFTSVAYYFAAIYLATPREATGAANIF